MIHFHFQINKIRRDTVCVKTVKFHVQHRNSVYKVVVRDVYQKTVNVKHEVNANVAWVAIFVALLG